MPLRIVELKYIPADGEPAFGGKAAGLARLIAAGAAVPPGFALEATDEPPEQWSNDASQEFCRQASELLRSGPIAVRSSAVGEDSAERSYAGLLATVLNVASIKDALAAAASIVASGNSDRVRQYQGAAADRLKCGIVVQSMVEARAAGVCFTRDPLGKDKAVIIEAVAGLGEALVSGTRQPERWRCYYSALGDWEPFSEKSLSVLEAREAIEIAAQAQRLAKEFQTHLDLEWAIDNEGRLWWLQARPITALKPLEQPVIHRSFHGDDGPVTVWSNWNVRETMPEPLYPLTGSYWLEILQPLLISHVFGIPRSSAFFKHYYGLDLINGRIYFNMNAVCALPLFGYLIKHLLPIMDSRIGATILNLFDKGLMRPRTISGSKVGQLLLVLAANFRMMLKFSKAFAPRKALRKMAEKGRAVAKRPPVAQMTDEELINELYLFEQPEFNVLKDLQIVNLGIIIYRAATLAFKDYPQALDLLVTGIPANPTTQISVQIDNLTEAALPIKALMLAPLTTEQLMKRLASDEQGQGWLKQFEEFLAHNGQRAPMEFELGAKRWSEDPTMILELIRAGLRQNRAGMEEKMAQLGARRQRAIDAAVSAAPVWQRPYMRMLAHLVELFMPLREAPKHYGMFIIQRARQAALELGRRICVAGFIDSPEDVFFLELSELIDLAKRQGADKDYQVVINERRAQLASFRTQRPPEYVRSDGVPILEWEGDEELEEQGILRGTAISAGCVSGPVRVLREPDPRAIADGDIIVLEFADPGWTPLFPRAAAVIMEVGGMMCHAAVVAREMGIPAVFGVRNATQILRDGQTVRVDGSAGTITVN